MVFIVVIVPLVSQYYFTPHSFPFRFGSICRFVKKRDEQRKKEEEEETEK